MSLTKGGDTSKSLLTISKAYHDMKGIGKLKLDQDSLSYDLTNTYLSENEQVELYKQIIKRSRDPFEISFFLRGIAKIEERTIDFEIAKERALNIIIESSKEMNTRIVAFTLGCSQSVIQKALSKKDIDKKVALGIVFMDFRDKEERKLEEQWEKLKFW